MTPDVGRLVVVELKHRPEHLAVFHQKSVPIDDVSVFSPVQGQLVIVQVPRLGNSDCPVEVEVLKLTEVRGVVIYQYWTRRSCLDEIVNLGKFLIKKRNCFKNSLTN